MGAQLQMARNTDAQLDTYTGPPGEVVMSTTDGRLRTHDGVTVGGKKHTMNADCPWSYAWPQNQFYAAPAGAAGAPTFRAIAMSDLPNTSVAVALAAAGTNQAGATPLTKHNNEVTTVATGTGVRLAPSNFGDRIFVANAGANALLVYPASGEYIGALSMNTPVSIPAGKTAIFVCCYPGKYYAHLSA